MIEESIGNKEANAANRRDFIVAAGSLSLTIVRPELVFGSAANQKIKLGIFACGSRADWITRLFLDNGGYEIAAAYDYFPEAVNLFGDKYNIPQSHRFTGLSGYKRLLEKKVDAVAVESPPYFHPEQAAAGVEAGVHVYVAKPIAVDVPGCNLIAAGGKKATEKKQCFLIDFQTRADALYQEAIKRVHEGAIGELAFGEASYHAGCPWERQFQFLEKDPKNSENRLRAWGLDRILSGDIITEQNIHTLDVASWILNQPPIQASGTCGRKVRTDGGDCDDYFAVVFEYPNKVAISFSSRQFEGYETSEGIRNRMFGSKGVLETEYGGQVIIRGEKPYEGGKTTDIFKQGVVKNIATFHHNIVNGIFDNPTVAPSVRSNLVTILGRTAAYKNEIVRWDELLKNPEKLEANLKGLKE